MAETWQELVRRYCDHIGYHPDGDHPPLEVMVGEANVRSWALRESIEELRNDLKALRQTPEGWYAPVRLPVR